MKKEALKAYGRLVCKKFEYEKMLGEQPNAEITGIIQDALNEKRLQLIGAEFILRAIGLQNEVDEIYNKYKYSNNK